MRIIHVLKGKANPDTMNGVNKVVHYLATEQFRLGHQAEVWGITDTPDRVHHSHDYPLRLYSSTRSRFSISRSLKKNLQKLLPEKTIVHLHSVFLPEFYSISRILKKRGVPWVLSPHSGYSPQSMKKNKLIKSVYMALFDRRVVSGARKVHALGESEINDLRLIAKHLDIVTIPNGQSIDEVKFIPVSCRIPLERPVFGFCGRLAKNHKGLDTLIQGFSDYKQEGGKGELWLIGDGPDKRILEDLSERAGSVSSIFFLGSMFGDIKLSHIAQLDVFAHTSRWEGIPMAVLEAAALGKPLLLSRETNLGFFLEKYKNGIVLAENSPPDITNALFQFERLFVESDLERLGERSKQLIEIDLKWQNIARNCVKELYAA